MSHKDKASCTDAYYIEMYIPTQGFNSKPININCLLQHIDPGPNYTLLNLQNNRI